MNFFKMLYFSEIAKLSQHFKTSWRLEANDFTLSKAWPTSKLSTFRSRTRWWR